MAIAANKVWIVVYPEFQLLDATGPAQVFSSANDEMRDARPASPDAVHFYDIRFVSPGGGEVVSNSGIAVMTESLPDPVDVHDSTVVVAGARCRDVAIASAELVKWLRENAGNASRYCSVCTGAFLLAEAGLLDNKAAATHWMDAAELRRHYPRVMVDDDPIFVKHDKMYTSAGVAAGIDLALALVEEDAGHRVALNVAKRLVVFLKRPGGQKQFSSELLGQFAEGGVMPRLAKWLKQHMREKIDTERMAAAMAMSARALHRRVVEEAQTTPAKLLMQLRLEKACLLLEECDASIKQIASRTGFASVYNLRRCFKQTLGVLPCDYRSKFSGRR